MLAHPVDAPERSGLIRIPILNDDHESIPGSSPDQSPQPLTNPIFAHSSQMLNPIGRDALERNESESKAPLAADSLRPSSADWFEFRAVNLNSTKGSQYYDAVVIFPTFLPPDRTLD
jgi:hypothetical protein